MKCSHCGGSLIYHPGNCLELAALKCMACGRQPVRASGPEGREGEMEEKKKKCSKCLDEKSLELFSKNKGNKDGHESRCKDCMKEKMQVYRDMKAGLEHGPAKRGRKTPRRAKIRPNPPTLQRASPPAEALRRAGKPSPTVTRSTPEQIIADLRRGLAIEIIDMIQEKYGI